MKKRLIAALIGSVLGMFLYGIAHKDSRIYSMPFHEITVNDSWNDIGWTIYKGEDIGPLKSPSPYVYGVNIYAELSYPYCTDIFPYYPSGCMYAFRESISFHFGLYTLSFDIPTVSIGWKFWSKEVQ